MRSGSAKAISLTKKAHATDFAYEGDTATRTPVASRMTDGSRAIRNEFDNAYANALEQSEMATRHARQKSTGRVAHSLNHPIGRAILEHGDEIEVGQYRMAFNARGRDGLPMNTAGFWKIEINADNEPYFVRAYEQSSGGISVGDQLVVKSAMCDSHGNDMQVDDQIEVVDAYDELVEACVARTGRVHVFDGETLASHCGERTIVQSSRKKQTREAAMVVPRKFAEMIHARVDDPMPEYDRILWGEYVKSGYEPNSQAQMDTFITQYFGPKPGASIQASQRKTAQDSETVDYFDELWGDTDPDYAKSLTKAGKLREKRESIRRQYAHMMNQAPDTRALAHMDNTIAKLAQQHGENVETIRAIVNDVSDHRRARAEQQEDMYTVEYNL